MSQAFGCEQLLFIIVIDNSQDTGFVSAQVLSDRGDALASFTTGLHYWSMQNIRVAYLTYRPICLAITVLTQLLVWKPLMNLQTCLAWEAANGLRRRVLSVRTHQLSFWRKGRTPPKVCPSWSATSMPARWSQKRSAPHWGPVAWTNWLWTTEVRLGICYVMNMSPYIYIKYVYMEKPDVLGFRHDAIMVQI